MTIPFTFKQECQSPLPPPTLPPGPTTIGSLSNDDGDVNENSIKAIGLGWQNNNFARPSHFFVHFFAVTAQLRCENAYNFTFCGGR